MRKHWKKILALVLAVAVVATIAFTAIDWNLHATDGDGEEVATSAAEIIEETVVLETPSVTEEATEAAEEETAEEVTTAEESTGDSSLLNSESTEETTAEKETTSKEEAAEEESTSEKASEAESTTEETSAAKAKKEDMKVLMYSNLDGVEQVAAGTECILTAELIGFEGYTYTVQWKRSADGGKTWEAVEGATELEYKFILTADNDDYVWKVTVTVPDEEFEEQEVEHHEEIYK